MNRFTALVVSALVVAASSQAQAYDAQCVGVLTGTWDNIVVPPGATCSLLEATVLGNVKALEKSRLRIDRSTVLGNLEGDKADIVQVFFSDVRQQISITGGGPAEAPAPLFNVCGFGMDFTPCEVLIAAVNVEEGNVQISKTVGSVLIQRLDVHRGNVKVEDNVIAAHELFFLDNSTVAQNLQIFKNIGPGNKFVQGNRVGENLQCFENEPPFVGRFNTAGQAEGQCAMTEVP